GSRGSTSCTSRRATSCATGSCRTSSTPTSGPTPPPSGASAPSGLTPARRAATAATAAPTAPRATAPRVPAARQTATRGPGRDDRDLRRPAMTGPLPDGARPNDDAPIPRPSRPPRRHGPEGEVQVFGADEQDDQPVDVARWVDLARDVLVAEG